MQARYRILYCVVEMTENINVSDRSVDIIHSLSGKVSVVGIFCWFHSLCNLFFSFAERLMEDVLEQIFQEMDAETLLRAELVSTHWRRAILHSRIWSRIFEDKV